MAKTPTELYRELALTSQRLGTELKPAREMINYERDRRDKQAEESAALRREVAELRTEVALLRQTAADALRRTETWAARWWGLAVAVTVALAGGGVAIPRKYP